MKNNILSEVWEFLKEHPTLWNQGTWVQDIGNYGIVKRDDTISCNTIGCLAGHICLRFAPAGTAFYRNYMSVNGQTIEYAEFAQEILEASSDEADYLFSGERIASEVDAFIVATPTQRQYLIAEDLAQEF